MCIRNNKTNDYVNEDDTHADISEEYNEELFLEARSRLPMTENNVESIERFILAARYAYNLIRHDEGLIFRFIQGTYTSLYWTMAYNNDIIPYDDYYPETLVPFPVIIESLQKHILNLKNNSV